MYFTHSHTKQANKHIPFLEYHITIPTFPLSTPTSCPYMEESSYTLSLYLEFLGISTPNLFHWFSFPIFHVCNLTPPLPLPLVSHHSLHSPQTKVLTNSKLHNALSRGSTQGASFWDRHPVPPFLTPAQVTPKKSSLSNNPISQTNTFLCCPILTLGAV